MARTTRCMDMFFDSRPRTELEYLITFSQINTELYLESRPRSKEQLSYRAAI